MSAVFYGSEPKGRRLNNIVEETLRQVIWQTLKGEKKHFTLPYRQKDFNSVRNQRSFLTTLSQGKILQSLMKLIIKN